MANSVIVNIDAPWLTPEEFAKRTGISVRTVRDYCAKGRLPIKPRKTDNERYWINNALLIKQALEAEY
ncbi:helix-turn-helix domain-containing protein [Teredinibacter turnerae]|uniref:helix-turn-helix domain-containing protein n=1 Tax=Teredinibacter turnerae TaxID=2426 RepID=UPI000475BE84|nr:helix-turn-helix domain-containing protein [Teredinibacter turnerae]